MKKLISRTICAVLALSTLSTHAKEARVVRLTPDKYAEFLCNQPDTISSCGYDATTQEFTIDYYSPRKKIIFHESELPALARIAAENPIIVKPLLLFLLLETNNDQESMQALTQAFIKTYISSYYNSYYRNSPKTFDILITHPAITYDAFLDALKETLSAQEIENLITASTSHSLLKTALNSFKTKKKQYTQWLIKCLTYKYAVKTGITLTPTETHMFFNWSTITSNFTITDFHFLETLVERERIALKNNKASFVHAVCSERAFIMDMYTQGWAIINNALLDKEYIMFRFEDYRKDTTRRSNTKTRRLKIIQSTDFFNENERMKYKKYFLFLNAAFFNNTNNRGSSTAHYATYNSNAHTVTVPTAEAIFEKLMLGDYYNRYQAEFDQLEMIHYAATNGKGVVLQLLFDQNNLDNTVYLSGSGATTLQLTTTQRKQTIVKTSDVINSMKHHMGNLREKDEFEFITPVTPYVKDFHRHTVHRHYFGTQEAVEKYYKKRDELFAKIAADYKAGAPAPMPPKPAGEEPYLCNSRYSDIYFRSFLPKVKI